ncbi:nitrate assimilation regulatory protein nirA [Purpureocillium lilacinum]|uniref:Nitrate assimilation regulatory protein nirA n=1 Tax=Purpureocillium lilacinum TaxID=33203 RepID=A0A179FJ36_PURLI|nr:nitrate assimilation regulatory protein nirA [Purpureocillium lilacinum]OAQ65596.1 nitrate assimilation regulatory protein nirA [Purpureocillium lilacinum]
MPHRHQVRMACQRCRRKRCDGEDPCQRCKDAGLECAFDHSRRESKDDLRAEIERLRRIGERNDALLDVLSSMNDADTYNTVVQRLMDSAVTRDSIYNNLPDHLKAVGQSVPIPAGLITPSSRRNSPATSSAAASSSNVRPVTCPHCHGALPASSSVTDSNESPRTTSERRLSGDAQSETNFLTIPASAAGCVPLIPVVLSLTGAEKTKQIDPWTRTGWPVTKIRDRFNSLLTWDYLPFCLLCKNPFLQDFASGDGRYCSPALVNSLLALSTRILDERQHPQQQQHQKEQQKCLAKSDADCGFPHSGCWDSQALFDEAETLISGKEHMGALPDIQTLGILALYQVSCGREAEARELAEAFKAEITKLCLREPLDVGKQDDQYMQVRSTTYCGAISLVRILKLLTAQPTGMHTTIMQDDGVTLDWPPCAYGPSTSSPAVSIWGWADGSNTGTLAGESRSQLTSLQLVPAKIFQLTEWVYKLLVRSPAATGDEVVLVYRRCLDWYEGFFAMLASDGSSSPFVAFIHMYYQFCQLSLFRPYVSMPLAGLHVHPREICLQAAQSILGLSEAYADTFGLRTVSPLMPYFVCASGLLSLAVEEPEHGILDAVSVPQHGHNDGCLAKTTESLQETIKQEPDDDPVDLESHYGHKSSGEQHNRPSPQPMPINMPIVTHARLLLSKMSFAHSAAFLAEGMLHRAPGSN